MSSYLFTILDELKYQGLKTPFQLFSIFKYIVRKYSKMADKEPSEEVGITFEQLKSLFT